MYKKLKDLRTANGYTCGYMAEKLEITKAYYSMLENGLRKLSYNRAVIIAGIFDMKPDEIFYEDHIKGLK